MWIHEALHEMQILGGAYMIGGNTPAQIQKRSTSRNEIGEQVTNWKGAKEIVGWLDLSSGDASYMTYNAKVQESTHVFICDYVPLPEDVTAENSRMVADGKIFDIMLIDDPMNMHKQLEIYLKFTGGQ